MVIKTVFKNLIFCLTIALLVISVAAGTSVSGAEEKAAESAKEETAAPPAQDQEEAEAEEQKSPPAGINPAARVNGVAISRKELDTSYNSYVQQQGMNTGMITDPQRYKQVQLEVLNGLIIRELLWQEAKKKDLVAKDAEVQQAISETKKRFPSEDEFDLRLAQSGLTEEDYKQFLTRELSIRELVQKDISEGISVSDEEVHGYYESNPDQFKAPEQVRARHILVKVDSGADEGAIDAAKKKIEGILAEAKGGADFAELAKKHSEGPSGPSGGDLGFFSRGQMVKPFEEAAFTLKPGEISGVVQTTFGYHIIKVEEKKEAQTLAEKDMQEQIRQYLHSGKVRNAVLKRVETLKAEGDVEILIGK